MEYLIWYGWSIIVVFFTVTTIISFLGGNFDISVSDAFALIMASLLYPYLIVAWLHFKYKEMKKRRLDEKLAVWERLISTD